MDKNSLIVLTTDIQAQMALVNEISGLVEERATGLSSDNPVRLESVAYQIHNFYNAVEDLPKIMGLRPLPLGSSVI